MLPAVMVDLGWPWWVTTITALVVGGLAVLIALRSSRPEVRGAMTMLVAFGFGAAVSAPFVMSDSSADGGAMRVMSRDGQGSGAIEGEVPRGATRLPFTFFITRYEFLGDPNNPHTVRYHSDGAVLTKSADGSSVTLTGRGSWDANTARAAGGGTFVVEAASGAVAKRGAWRAKRFISFHQFAGFWGLPIKEELWQGPPGSRTFSGFLKLRVELEGYGSGVLTAWCAMPEAVRAMHRIDDGMTLVGPRFRFTNWKANIEGPWGGPMFYGPGSSG